MAQKTMSDRSKSADAQDTRPGRRAQQVIGGNRLAGMSSR